MRCNNQAMVHPKQQHNHYVEALTRFLEYRMSASVELKLDQ